MPCKKLALQQDQATKDHTFEPGDVVRIKGGCLDLFIVTTPAIAEFHWNLYLGCTVGMINPVNTVNLDYFASYTRPAADFEYVCRGNELVGPT